MKEQEVKEGKNQGNSLGKRFSMFSWPVLDILAEDMKG